MKRPMEHNSCEPEWTLFGEAPAPVPEVGTSGGVGGVAAEEHPYFKKRIFADEPLKDALDEYVPTACDLLMAEGRAASALLLEAAKAFDAGHLDQCAKAAAQCAAAAWHLLQKSPTEAVLHAHALSHAMLAATEADEQKAMLHADLSLSLCPDLPIAAVHTVMKLCNERCQNVLPILEDGLAWEIPSMLPATAKTPEVQKPIIRKPCSHLSVMGFRDAFLKTQQPGVIEGHLLSAGWSTARWSDLRFWAGRHGHRTIPIEMGFHENDAQSIALQHSDSEGSMRLGDFVRRFLLPSNTVLKNGFVRSSEAIDEWSASPVAYMAQHQLLLQIPELRRDILIPQYCALGELQTVNVWIGTAGTVTALHYDLDDNFLVQVSGYKYLGWYEWQDLFKVFKHPLL